MKFFLASATPVLKSERPSWQTRCVSSTAQMSAPPTLCRFVLLHCDTVQYIESCSRSVDRRDRMLTGVSDGHAVTEGTWQASLVVVAVLKVDSARLWVFRENVILPGVLLEDNLAS